MPNYYDLLKPLLFTCSPEVAHTLSILALQYTPLPRQALRDAYPNLKTEAFGLSFPNPLGIAAGYDKNGVVLKPLLNLGFGFVEAGTLTPKPQSGNPKPRLFRLREDHAVINRMGFNNKGQQWAANNFQKYKNSPLNGIVGINIGANKTSENKIDDYALGIKKMAPFADYLVINISSPNTPGLRDLQGGENLIALFEGVNKARLALNTPKPILLKVAPDLNRDQIKDISEKALEYKMDGLIVSNTTLARPHSLKSKNIVEAGGLSGAPLFDHSTLVLKEFYKNIGHAIPLIGVGGIGNAEQAYAKIRAGASLIQIYSALIYQGPALITDILTGLSQHLAHDGFNHIHEAVGADVE